MVERQDTQRTGRFTQGSVFRILVSGVVLVAFFGGLLVDYWPDLAPAALQLFNSARSVGATEIESQYFIVKNSSHATDRQVRAVVSSLEREYDVIQQYTKMAPPERLALLVVDGTGPALIDGQEIVIHYDNGRMDTSLAPLYMVLMIEDIRIDLTQGIVPAGGHALQVLEGAGLAEPLIRQPLDGWTALFRQSKRYLPLEEAWVVGVPNDDHSVYTLMRALLESGSFFHWFTGQYGVESARRLANGESIDSLTGKSLAENETAWLNRLAEQPQTAQPCAAVIQKSSVFFILCRELGKNP